MQDPRGYYRGGSIEVIAGVMFSGKSEELMRRVRRALRAHERIQAFKSILDDRAGYGGLSVISSHDGTRIEAVSVRTSAELAEKVAGTTDLVAIDEAQFLDEGIVDVVQKLADEGRRVIISGTDMDFRARPFGPMGALLAIAERVDKLPAICEICGDPATRNQRLIDGKPAPSSGPTILVGAGDSYIAVCRRHHIVPEA